MRRTDWPRKAQEVTKKRFVEIRIRVGLRRPIGFSCFFVLFVAISNSADAPCRIFATLIPASYDFLHLGGKELIRRSCTDKSRYLVDPLTGCRLHGYMKRLMACSWCIVE
jgi:hypothetical protein